MDVCKFVVVSGLTLCLNNLSLIILDCGVRVSRYEGGQGVEISNQKDVRKESDEISKWKTERDKVAQR